MRSEWIKKAAAALLAALLLELIPCQFSFWTTVTKKTEDLTARVEILAGYTAIEELDQDVANDAAAADSGEDVADSATTAAGDQTTEGGSALYLFDGSYLDDAGYLHVPDGSLTLRVKNYKGSLQRIFLNLDFLYNQPVLAEVFARDEGNSYPFFSESTESKSAKTDTALESDAEATACEPVDSKTPKQTEPSKEYLE